MQSLDVDEGDRESLSVLLIEDNPQDEYTVRRMLDEAPAVNYSLRVVQGFSAASNALAQPFDICLLDYDLGEFTAADLLGHFKTADLSGPVLLLTGYDEFSLDQSITALGITDFISKSELRTSLLDRTLRYAHRRFLDKRKLNFLAHHDPLTGLYNRHAFLQRLDGWLASADYDTSDMYLLYIDLDGFKAVNDTWGHDTGDKVLRHAATCIRGSVRKSDIVARYGGDEIIAAVAHVDDQDIVKLPEKILQSLAEPLVLNGHPFVVTASIGVARAHHAPHDSFELIRLADHAMFAAKHAGRNTSRVYDDQIPVANRGRAELERDLRIALEDGALHMHFQPVVDINSREISSAEALARWQHPEQGNIPPSVFIELAEECGLMRQFTAWSLDAALAALAGWQSSAALPENFRMAVNVSSPMLLDPGFPAQLDAALAKYALERKQLRLEITENLFVHASAAVYLQELVYGQLSLALDDFGTGYSSLAMLSQLPIDTLKIDRSFVQRMQDDARAASLTRALITLGREMQMQVIAEGIETQAEHELLQEHGCSLGQGYFYARPCSGEALLDMLTAKAGVN